MTNYIQNPILPGFNPDPSIIRVGDDYYIATSTFEWYPGVQIHHSRDLIHWRLVSRPLTRANQLDMRGEPDSCGVWAPCLSYADGLFWLIYSDMKRKGGSCRDCYNYLVTAPSVEGPWSDPVYLNATGFDPSLFHDEDGRKWLLNMWYDYRNRPSRFGGTALQEYDPIQKKLVGPIRNIFKGSELGFTEGPHLYKRHGFYYLILAEGGTGYGHAVSMARSRQIEGPYEIHPDTTVVTSRGFPNARLQRSGHGDFVETQHGETYLVHLCSRPLPGLFRSPLGRETAIQKCEWGADGWLRLAEPLLGPQEKVLAPNLPLHPFLAEPERTTFAPGALPLAFQWLRTPQHERLFSLDDRPGYLRLFGRESIGSWFEQSLIARRQTAYDYDAETKLEADPQSHNQMAGLVAYYNRSAYHYLALTFDEKVGVCLQILTCNGQWPNAVTFLALDEPVPVKQGIPVSMRIEVRGVQLKFFWSQEGEWQHIGPVLDNSVLSDECGEGEQYKNPGSFMAGSSGNFTGAFVGMSANDMSGFAMPADFAYFDYKNV